MRIGALSARALLTVGLLTGCGGLEASSSAGRRDAARSPVEASGEASPEAGTTPGDTSAGESFGDASGSSGSSGNPPSCSSGSSATWCCSAVRIPLSKLDTSCTSGLDCIAVTVSESGECCCPDPGAINRSSLVQYDHLAGSLFAGSGGSCGLPCPAAPAPECVHGTCTICYARGEPPGCKHGP